MINFQYFSENHLGIFFVSIEYEWRLMKKFLKNAKYFYAKNATLNAVKIVTIRNI